MFYGKKAQTRAVVPASAILHLHDRTWVYVPLGSGHFKRIEVQTGNMLPDNQAGNPLGNSARSAGAPGLTGL